MTHPTAALGFGSSPGAYERGELIRHVRELVRDVPPPIQLPYRTDVYSCRGT